MTLTKDEILNIQPETKTITLGAVGEIKIKQLTNRELNQVNRIQYGYGQVINDECNDEQVMYSLVDKLVAKQEAKLTCIVYSLNVDDENWNTEEINGLPASIIDTIYDEICTFNDL